MENSTYEPKTVKCTLKKKKITEVCNSKQKIQYTHTKPHRQNKK